MLLLTVVLCSAVCGFLWPRGTPPAIQRLTRQLQPRPSPKSKFSLLRGRLHRGDLHRQSGGLGPGRFGARRLAPFGGSAVALGPAQVHPPEPEGPLGRVDGAGRRATRHVVSARTTPPTEGGHPHLNAPLIQGARSAAAQSTFHTTSNTSHTTGNLTDEQVAQSRQREKILRRATAITVGLSCAVVLGGAPGILVGLLAGLVAHRSFGRLARAEERRRRSRLIADLPLAIDLLAACLRGGTPWGEAVEAVAGAVGGPLGEDLHGVAVQIRLGADPEAVWLSLAAEPALASFARTAIRAVQSGAAPAGPLARLARDQRRTARTAAAARARTAGIMSLAPLGACFLPGFVLLGVVPAIASIASTILLPW